MGSFNMPTRTLVVVNFCICLSLGHILSSLGGHNERKRGGGGGMGGRRREVYFKESDMLPSVTVASIHDNVVLECKAGGSSPTIHWLKNGQRIQQGEDRDYMNDEPAVEETINEMGSGLLKLGFTNSKLYLDCVTHDMEAEYTCVAETTRHRISQTTVLVIDDKSDRQPSHDNCIAKRSSRHEPARVYLWTSHRIEIQGASVQLYCRVEGHPKPAIAWFDKSGNEVTSDNDDYEILQNGDLLIRSISWTNMGSYLCKASNGATDQVSTFLYPAASPRRRSGK